MATDRRPTQAQPADEEPVRVYTCGRIGMQANPPRPRLGRLLRRR